MRPLVTTYGAMALFATGSASVRADPEVQGIAIATGVAALASILSELPQRNDARIDAAYHHMSNGKLLHQTNNPGTEIIGLTFSIPIR